MYISATLLALVAAAAAAPAASDAGVAHLPIGRRSLAPRADGTVDFAALLQEWNATLAKYHAKHRLGPLSSIIDESLLGDVLEKRAVSNVKLTDQGADVEYYGPGKVGDQTFTIDFDTGSADFFVPGPNCPSCHGTPYKETGTPQNKTTSITYGSGQVTGNDYFDTVCVGGLCAPDTNVIALTSAKGFSTSKSSSLMGLGFEEIAQSGEPTFFERLVKLGKLTKNEFSFYLGRESSGTGPQSTLTFGGTDKSKYTGKFTSHKVTKKGYWQLAIAGAAVSGKKAILTAGQAAIDSGTTVIIAPTVAAVGLFSKIPGALPVPLASGSATETVFAFPCDTKSQVELIFGSEKYVVNSKDLSLGTLTKSLALGLGNSALSGLCLASIIADDINPGEELYVVGDTFLKNWYATFNYDVPSVSFAKSVGYGT